MAPATCAYHLCMFLIQHYCNILYYSKVINTLLVSLLVKGFLSCNKLKYAFKFHNLAIYYVKIKTVHHATLLLM